jgi:pimeloyl-ACP methyl ester carboxylesterase
MNRKSNLFTKLAFVFVAYLMFAAQISAQQQTSGKWATLYGQKIHYLDVGQGPVVVLLHGMGGSTANWPATVPALAAKYRVIVPDQIGFGKSDKPLISYRIGTYVDFLDALLRELKVEKATLVGNSMGGWISAAFALAHPAKTESIVLVDAAGFALGPNDDPKVLHTLNPSTREGVRQLLPLILYNYKPFLTDAGLDFFVTQRLAAGDGYTINALIESIKRGEDMLDGRLGNIKTPTLIVWGKQDGLTPLVWGERFKKEISGAEMIVFDQCGHSPQMEKPVEFNAALLKFLEKQPVVNSR